MDEIILEALFVQSPGAQLVDEFVMCVISPVIFDLGVREEILYEMTTSPQNFVSSCDTTDKGGAEELRCKWKNVVAVKMVYRPVAFSKIRDRGPDRCGNIAAGRAYCIFKIEATG